MALGLLSIIGEADSASASKNSHNSSNKKKQKYLTLLYLMNFEGHLGEAWDYPQEDSSTTNLARHLWDPDRGKGFLLLHLTTVPTSTELQQCPAPTQTYSH